MFAPAPDAEVTVTVGNEPSVKFVPPIKFLPKAPTFLFVETCENGTFTVSDVLLDILFQDGSPSLFSKNSIATA